jgi:hypothetical protein
MGITSRAVRSKALIGSKVRRSRLKQFDLCGSAANRSSQIALALEAAHDAGSVHRDLNTCQSL